MAKKDTNDPTGVYAYSAALSARVTAMSTAASAWATTYPADNNGRLDLVHQMITANDLRTVNSRPWSTVVIPWVPST